MKPRPFQTVLDYHEATKHHYHRYARSAGAMDWANQPVPFRFYEGLTPIRLPLAGEDPAAAYEDLYAPVREPAKDPGPAGLGLFLELSLALSAWKTAGGSRWSLRINPSSGNLHPTECYLILPESADLPGGLFHYNPLWHALEPRAGLPEDAGRQWGEHFGGKGFLVALSSIYWRESWKYGERAYRYGNLDAGHALAALSYAARLMNWRWTCLTAAGDDQIRILLGFDRTAWVPLEAETPDLIGWVSVDGGSGAVARSLPDSLVRPFAQIPVKGRPNRLSRQAADWPIIREVAIAAEKGPTTPLPWVVPPAPLFHPPPRGPGAAAVIRKRRSAVAFDPKKTVSADAFLAILDRTRPRAGIVPFSAAPASPAVDLLVFVHRVTGLAPGLYLFIRTGESPEVLRAEWDSRFQWRPVRPGFPLWLLADGDMTFTAMTLGCHQEIAGDGAFALAMLSPLGHRVREQPFWYRHLHWECGMIGQVLYLEAEAHGIRGTGIGCFFDDPVAALLGIRDRSRQSLYHFTVGHPVEDPRLATLPPYHHLEAL